MAYQTWLTWHIRPDRDWTDNAISSRVCRCCSFSLVFIAYNLGTSVRASGDFAHTFFTCQMQNHWKS